MARNSTGKGGPARIRFIMLEADMQDGDFSQVTAAIQNALRPSQPNRVVQLPSLPNTAKSGNSEGPEADIIEGAEGLSEEPPPTRVTRTRKSRVAKTPTVLDDLDIETEPGLKSFVAGYDVKTDVDRYLVIALWFRDARNTSSVTADHVYTCFKLLGWSTAMADFSKPLRNLRDEQSFKGGSREGFSLTLTGAGKIESKKRSG